MSAYLRQFSTMQSDMMKPSGDPELVGSLDSNVVIFVGTTKAKCVDAITDDPTRAMMPQFLCMGRWNSAQLINPEWCIPNDICIKT